MNTKAFDEIYAKGRSGEELPPVEKAIYLLWESTNRIEWAVRAAAELADKNAAIESAITALRAVVHDRPTAHTDAVWQQVNKALAALDGEK